MQYITAEGANFFLGSESELRKALPLTAIALSKQKAQLFFQFRFFFRGDIIQLKQEERSGAAQLSGKFVDNYHTLTAVLYSINVVDVLVKKLMYCTNMFSYIIDTGWRIRMW